MVSVMLIGLVPSMLVRKDTDITNAVEMYRGDLPSPAVCATAIKNCDTVLFPQHFHVSESPSHAACHLL